ncbi:MAG TPA: amidohydrolase family protein [Blastocatellia bacterium]|jgi:imidazolonepropionase-like amidohydrolase|nr:amidohydrolase family protein [Blastocatellia bacterium]
MKRLLLSVVMLAFVGFFSPDAREQNNENIIAILGASVIDGKGGEPSKQTVVIRGDRIEAVGPKVEPPAGARRIDAEGMTLLPGLFDLHTHLPYSSVSGADDDWPKNLKAYLYCGVTSVVDFGAYPEMFEPMRRLIRTGVVAAPRISLAVRITTPGGHGSEGGRGDFFSLEVSTAREARAAVRRALPYQPDVIKAFTDGWRYGAAPDMTSMNEETLTALVDEAHKNGLEVLTHTVTLERAKIAARAGVDVIAHGVGDRAVDEELFKLMKAKSTTYVPTLAVYEPRGRDILTPLLGAVLAPSARLMFVPPQNPPMRPADGSAENGDPPRLRRWTILQNNTAALLKAGITFGVGTDSGVTGTHHGWATLRELQLLVAGGLTPIEAITAATAAAARAIKVDVERGTIAPGKLADLVLIDGEPHKDIRDIEKIKRVFLGGREIDRERLAHEIAEPGLTTLPAIKARELIDDFESANGRSSIDTLWVNSTDHGVGATKMLFGRVRRKGGDHALSVTARMSEKDRALGRVDIPLGRGAIESVDVSAFRGVLFDARGDGDYQLIASAYAAPNLQAPFKASPQWRTVRIDFSSLKQPQGQSAPWPGDKLRMLSFEIARAAGAFAWLEIDNLRFYR